MCEKCSFLSDFKIPSLTFYSDYNVSWFEFLWIHQNLSPLSFLDLDVHFFSPDLEFF